MGICESKSNKSNAEPIANKTSSNEVITMNLINKLKKSVCKIIKGKDHILIGTGIFMYLSKNDKTQRFLLTNYHVIQKFNRIMELEIYGKNSDMNSLICSIDLNNHYVTNFKEQEGDVSLIRINDNDLLILDNVKFLNYDNNYQNGYEIYKNKDIFSLGYPSITQLSYGKGKIIEILEPEPEPKRINPGEVAQNSIKAQHVKPSYMAFEHSIQTMSGCSGSPIVFLDGNEIKVVGIHQKSEHSIEGKKHFGIFIGSIVDKIIDETNEKGNFILGEISINKTGEDIQIINSDVGIFEMFGLNDKGNESQIRKCQIMIDGNNIPFSYTYKFNKEGKHTIRYSFKEKITDICHLFYNCINITYLDFSHFNSKGISSMAYIFNGCSSLADIDLLNLNTEDVTDMTEMFYSCKSLTKLDLSGFNTKKVTNMTAMFFGCTSLKSINFQSFNTENVTDMNSMFYACESLKELNLSNFNTKNVTDMSGMFFGCRTLKRLDLSSFNTEKVVNMGFMFNFCESLTYLDLTNFSTKSVKYMGLFNFKEPATNMTKMFGICPQLKSQNVKVKDRKILEALELISNGEIDLMDMMLPPNPFMKNFIL